ncbi:MAG: hypothetical protein P4M15_06665 [Alphaproteobacteria bacterium]|nr:hypothetical protein [Alphaproteobacteria bacterium]
MRESFDESGSRTLLFGKVKIRVKKILRQIRFFASSGKESGRKKSMTRSEVLLAILAASNGRPYTPVQIQKAVFLVTKNLPNLVTQGANFGFEPYDYGPFDQSVYAEAEALSQAGAAEITRQEGTRWNRYAASDRGLERGAHILDSLRNRERDYIKKVSAWVRAQTFESLVKSIYDQYPEMRVNSVFRG